MGCLWIVILSLFGIWMGVEGQRHCRMHHSCPKIKPVTKLDFERYSGKWVEFQHGKNVDYQCGVFDYVYKNSVEFELLTDAQNKNGDKITGSSQIVLEPECRNPRGSYLSFQSGSDSEGPDKFLPSELNIFVLETDYENYTVEYGCSVTDGVKDETLCVMSRLGKPALDQESLEKLLKDNNIDISIVTPSRSSDCPAPK